MSVSRKREKIPILFFVMALFMMALLAATQNSAAGEPAGGDPFALGNEAYVDKDYDQAILNYRTALERDGYSPSLLYNLGNAYYMKKEIGKAILNYERALYLDPGNADIKANLALARKNFGLVTSAPPEWKAFFDGLTLNGWTWVAAMALGVFSLLVLMKGIRPNSLKGSSAKWVGFACFLAFTAAGAGMAAQYGSLDRGVVTAENTRLRVSPFDSAATSGVVKNGKVVNLADTYKGYVFVKAANGQSGWIPENAVSAVLPSNGYHRRETSLTKSAIPKIDGNGGAPNLNKT